MSTESPIILSGHSDWITNCESLTDTIIVTSSLDNTVRIWSLTENRTDNEFKMEDGTVCDIAVLNHSTILVVKSNIVSIMDIYNGQEKASCLFQDMLSLCVAYNETTAVIADSRNSLYKIEWSYGQLNQTRQVHNAHRNRIKGMYSYGSTFATCSDDETAKLWDASSLAIIQTFSGHHDSVLSVAYDDKHLVTGTLDCEIRVFDVRSSVQKKVISTHSHEVNCLRILPSGKFLVSSDDNAILVHELPSGKFKNKFEYSMTIHAMSVLKSGSIAVAGEEPYDVNVFEIRDEDLGPPFMEEAFNSVMKDPTRLTIPFIKETIRSEHVNSAADLFCGHNIILLSIRVGLIKNTDLDRFNGDIWYFENNLYYPASKLTSENPDILYPIFRHAEDIGIIRDGYKFRVEHENRVDSHAQFESIRESVTALSIRLSNVEHNMHAFQNRFEQIENAIEVNSQNFQYLFESIQKQQRHRKYASIAKVFLSLIPVIGNTAGLAVDAGTNIFLGLTSEDLLDAGLDFASSRIDNLSQVDVSNALVTYCVLSKKGMSRMEPNTRNAVTTAVERSDFKTMDNLRAQLIVMVQDIDRGSKEWLNLKSQSSDDDTQNTPLIPGESSDNEAIARRQFNSFAKARDTCELKIPDATEALNMTFRILQIEKNISEHEFEDLFMELSEELDVLEDTFVDIFNALYTKLDTVDVESLTQKYEMIFDSTKRETVSAAFASRLLRSALNDLKKEGLIGSDIDSAIVISPERMKYFDNNGDDKICREEFVQAALCIIHGIE